MRIFIDTATNQYWQLDDDVTAVESVSSLPPDEAEVTVRRFFSATGIRLSIPDTLVPAELPEPPSPSLDEEKLKGTNPT